MATRRRKRQPVASKAARKRPMKLGTLQAGWLEAFVEAADHNRTSAAVILGVSQSTIKKYIDSLEFWYGRGPSRPLMDSDLPPPSLTPDGIAFLPKAREILALIRAALPEPVKVEPAQPIVAAREIRVPPPVVSVLEGDGTIFEADRDRPVLIPASTVGEGNP